MIIYKAINIKNKKVYIGQTIKTLKVRRLDHINKAKRKVTNVIFHNALRKYGGENNIKDINVDIFKWFW